MEYKVNSSGGIYQQISPFHIFDHKTWYGLLGLVMILLILISTELYGFSTATSPGVEETPYLNVQEENSVVPVTENIRLDVRVGHPEF